MVNFIGDPSHAEIPISKIEKFDKRFEDFSKTKKRGLLNSIICAKKIIKGEIAFNNHMIYQNNLNNVQKKKDVAKRSREEEIEEVEEQTGDQKVCPVRRKRQRGGEMLNKKRSRKVSSSIDDGSINENFMGTRHRRPKLIVNDEDSRKDKDDNLEDEEESESECESEISEEKFLEENLKTKIKELLFFKIELPSSTSNKSIISTLEDIHGIVHKINSPNLHKLIPDLTQYLICLSTNKNQTVASKAVVLTNLIQEKILSEIFNFSDCEKILHSENCDWDDRTNNDTSELTSMLANITINSKIFESESLSTRSIKKYRKESNLVRRKSRNDFSFTNNHKSGPHDHRDHSNIITNEEEESNSLSEMSINTDKTDCEDMKIYQKQRIAIFPLEKKHIYSILKNYFEEFNCNDEDEFYDGLFCGKLFNLEKSRQCSIKCHYMRRRVCYKLFKVFNKLVSYLNNLIK